VTAALARAAAAARVRRFIFMSSIAVMGTSSDAPFDAAMEPDPQTDYGRSKLEGERALERELAGSETDWCILRPPVVYGPGNPGNMERLLRLIGLGIPLPFGAIRNRRSFMYIDNLIDAVLTVLRHPAPIRARFVLGDATNLATPELVSALAVASGRRVRQWPVPVWVLRVLAKFADVAGKLLGRGLPFDSYSVDRLRESLTVNPAPFEKHFAWHPPVTTDEALAATCRDLIKAGNR